MKLEDAFQVDVVRPTDLRARLYRVLEQIARHPERLVELRHQSGARAYLIQADVLEQMVREREHSPVGRLARFEAVPVEIHRELDGEMAEPWTS